MTLSESTGGAGHRLTQIDALRGIAALWVVLYHYSVRYEELFGHTSHPGFYVIDGRMGVHLFFMISGFVILMSLDRIKRVRDFFYFRWARLYPTFWICAVITYLITTLSNLPGRTVGFTDALVNITMLSITLRWKPIDAVYWSLEVELFFYAFLAFLVVLRLRIHLVIILASLVLLNGVLLSIPGAAVELPAVVKAIRILFTMRYLHFFLFGILCYELYAWRAASGKGLLNFPLLGRFSTIALLCGIVSFLETPLDECLAMMMLGALFFTATQFRVKFLESKVLVFLGACSYPLYTLHQNIGFSMIKRLEELSFPPVLAIGITTLLAVGLAHLLSRCIENPSNRILRAWYKGTSNKESEKSKRPAEQFVPAP
jgi:peptidoglycan/LPS O-acetylase OafA/YrhL